MIGHEIAGRYQIIERIGGGGMALVYRAQDLLLNRFVAVKVLRQQFVNDEEFIRRFRREAQSAASLSHPNVVSIYDVGEEDEIHYIVMEYIEGQNLNEIIKDHAPLQVDEAIRIASQICDALDHAHHNQIIHRDIKPHNILIGRNGRVKVTDFGIARAVTSTTITQTGSVVGSVHYFSPEHAKGVATGEKSDLYSLGIVMYQTLTGQLPFFGESPISVALKHLQEEFEEPRKVNRMIPQSVENIILKSMRKNPDERYQSAREMLRDLETCLLPERRTESKLEFAGRDEDSTRVMPAIKEQQMPSAPRRSREDGAVEGPTSKAKKGKKSSRAVMWALLSVLVIVLLGGSAWYITKQFEVPNVQVPNLINKSETDAKNELNNQGLAVGKVTQLYNDKYGPDMVYEQSKVAGEQVKKGSLIDLTVSIAKPLQKMADVNGVSLDDAKQELIALGIKEDNIGNSKEFDDTVDAGKVIKQDPAANADIDPDTVTVHLVISKGKETVAMPDLTNKTQQEAQKTLGDLGLKYVSEEESSFVVEKGKVIEQFPYNPGDSVERGQQVKLTISTGYPSEAVDYSYGVPVAPAQPDKNSTIHIVFSDAKGDNQDWGTKTINTEQTLSVGLVLAPDKNGLITVYRDNQPYASYQVSYIDAKQGTVPVPDLPGMAPFTPDAPPTGSNNGVTGMTDVNPVNTVKNSLHQDHGHKGHH